eukprot:6484017-Amphidinium_carterae.1
MNVKQQTFEWNRNSWSNPKGKTHVSRLGRSASSCKVLRTQMLVDDIAATGWLGSRQGATDQGMGRT